MIRAYHSPQGMEEALALLARGAVAIGGATALYTSKSSRQLEVVDVTRLGLDAIELRAGELVVGASVTLRRLAEASQLPGMAGALLRKAARQVASEPLRNMITLGGNLAALNYWADMPPVLLALDASVEVQRHGEPARRVPIAACLQGGSRPWEGGLITSVTIPISGAAQGFGYERFVRTVTDYSLATACVTMDRDGPVFRNVHVVIGAVQARPFRATDFEARLEGKPFDPQGLQAALQQSDIPIAPNFRASPAWRRQVIGVLIRRALTTAYQWGKES